MNSVVFFFVLLKSLIQYPQPVGDVWDEETRLRMEVRAKELEWERIRLEQEVEQLPLKQVQLLQIFAVAIPLVLMVILWIIGCMSSLRREEFEEGNNGANAEEVRNAVGNQDADVGNEAVNEAANAENNNHAAHEVQEEENNSDDMVGRILMERIQWPVQDLKKGCEWTMGLMDRYTVYFQQVLSNSFYPVLQRAIGVGSAFEGWSPREQDVVYQVLIPMTPPRGHSFHLELDSAGERPVRNFSVRVQLECTCRGEQQGENMLCFLHHPEEELRSNQDPSLLDTLCTGSYLDAHKTARWFCQLVKAIWPALSYSHTWHLTLLPSRRSCQFKVTNGRESFRIEMLFGVRRDDSHIFVSSQTQEIYTPSTTWPESYAVAEAAFFKLMAKQALPDSLHLQCLQFFTRLQLGIGFSTYTMKTIAMHLLNAVPVSSWRRRDFLQRLVDIVESLRICVEAKSLNHFIVGNRRLPRDIHVPRDVQTEETRNLFHHLARDSAAHKQARSEYRVLRKSFLRAVLGEE